MSLWLRRHDADGNVHHYAIPFDPLGLIALVGVLMGLSLSFVVAFRDVAMHQPDQTALTIGVGLACGLTMFVIAKLSVIRAGTLVSFGPTQMARSMRLLYIVGYGIMGCAALLTLLYQALI